MANIVYTKFLAEMAANDLDWETSTIRFMLERDTSAYAPDKYHDFLDSFTGGGGVEISVVSYGRQTMANGAINIDDANDRIELDCDNVAFGNLETGQTVQAIIVYQQTGGDDLSPADDVLICYIDTATGLPAVLGGGAFNITIDDEGLIQISQS